MAEATAVLEKPTAQTQLNSKVDSYLKDLSSKLISKNMWGEKRDKDGLNEAEILNRGVNLLRAYLKDPKKQDPNIDLGLQDPEAMVGLLREKVSPYYEQDGQKKGLHPAIAKRDTQALEAVAQKLASLHS